MSRSDTPAHGRTADLLLLLAAAVATRDFTDMQLIQTATRARAAGDAASEGLLLAVLRGRCES